MCSVFKILQRNSYTSLIGLAISVRVYNNGQMFGDKNNPKDPRDLRDNSNPLPGINVTDSPVSISYSKTNKLIMALYMVTDVMDSNEPIRYKLRNLGADILTDIYSKPNQALGKIAQVMSFLEIALTVKMVTEMNANILKKEFAELKKSVDELTHKNPFLGAEDVDLSDFFQSNLPEASATLDTRKSLSLKEGSKSNSVGVQKGSTLMSALKKMSDKMPSKTGAKTAVDFDALKKERRDQIKDIVSKNSNGVTITDIRKFAYGTLASCGEKTLQRELIAMVKENVLKKTGEKRWSRYFLASSRA
jgi:hypothetical protein